MNRALLYLIYAVILWCSALSVNYVSYSISEETVAKREMVFLSFEQSEIPHSSFKDSDVNFVSFQQRGLDDQKKNFYRNFFGSLSEAKIQISGCLFIKNEGVDNFRFYKLPPFKFLSHQFLI